MDDTKLGLMSVCMYLSVYTEEEDVMLYSERQKRTLIVQ